MTTTENSTSIFTNSSDANVTEAPDWRQTLGALLHYSHVAQYINFPCQVVMLSVGVVASILALTLVVRSNTRYPRTFLALLISLLLTCLVQEAFVKVMFVVVWTRAFQWDMGEWLCRTYGLLSYMCTGATLYQMILLQAYMLLFSKAPEWSRRLGSKTGTASLLAAFWILALACNLQHATSQGLVTFGNHSYCAPLQPVEIPATSRFLFYAYLVTINVLPCLTMVILGAFVVAARCRQCHLSLSGRTYTLVVREFPCLALVMTFLVLVCRGPLDLYRFLLVCGYQNRFLTVGFLFTKDLLFFMSRSYSSLVPLCLLFGLRELRQPLLRACCPRSHFSYDHVTDVNENLSTVTQRNMSIVTNGSVVSQNGHAGKPDDQLALL